MTIYRISRSSYLGEPEWARDEGDKLRIKGNLPLRSLEKYLERRSDISFVLYKDYGSKQELDPESPELREEDILCAPQPRRQSFQIMTGDMVEALKGFSRKIPGSGKLFPKFKLEHEVAAPYLFFITACRRWTMFCPIYPHHIKSS